MNLHLKYRPKTLADVRGNAETVVTLTGLLQCIDDAPHSFLIYGPTGCGKTTLARIIASELGCDAQDLREVDVADYRGIDNVREIIRQTQFMPLAGKVRVWILDEAHRLTGDAANALLKILEDTPKHVYFILCTTDPNKILKTVRGRCSQLQVGLLTEREMMHLLRHVVRKEGQEVQREVYDQIITTSEGHPRNALQILGQVLSVTPDQQLEVARKALEEERESIELCRALMKGASWGVVRKILTGLKTHDPEAIRRHVLGYAQSVLLDKEDKLAGRIMEEFMEPTYDAGFPLIVYASFAVINS